MNNINRLTYKPFGLDNKFVVEFWEKIPSYWKPEEILQFKNALVIVDTSISKNYVDNILNRLRKIGLNLHIFNFKFGPKSLKNLSNIWRKAVCCVPEVLIGIGGGTTSDLVGFAAACYQRGIPHVLFPTTTLGMTDASIGGKTAIDFAGVKNSVGAVHYPILVVNILKSLENLPKDEFWSGFGEIVKAGALFDKEFFLRLEKLSKNKTIDLKNKDLLDIIRHSAHLKMKNSQEPPQHKIKLLYGHAVGHALETLLKNAKHGECVAIGMNIEGAIACYLGIWKKDEWLRQKRLLKAFGLPVEFPKKVSLDSLLSKMLLYKKLVTSEGFQFILPKKIGEVASTSRNGWLTTISKKEIKSIFKKIL